MTTHWVLQVDPDTGITLAADGTWAVRGNAHYDPFESLDQAEGFCATKLRERPDTEWCIFEGDNRAKGIKVYRDDAYLKARAAARSANRRVSLAARIRKWLAR
jgi:hypothetical protein